MSTQTGPDEVAGVWDTFRGSSTAVKAVLGGVFVNKVGGFLSIFLVLFLTSAGYSAGQAATALGVYGFGAVFGVLLGGALADRLGPRDSTVISMAGTAVLVAALLYLPNYPLLLAAVAVVGGAQQIYRPASATLLAELTPEHRQVMIFAMYRFALNLGTMAAPLIGFGLYRLGSENYDLLFWGEALIALAYGVVAYLTLPGRDRPTAPTADATDGADTAATGSYLEVLRDRRYVLYLIAIFFNGVVYIQYLSTLPLDVAAAGVDLFWYTFAVALNGFIVIAFELPLTKVSQRWPFRLTLADVQPVHAHGREASVRQLPEVDGQLGGPSRRVGTGSSANHEQCRGQPPKCTATPSSHRRSGRWGGPCPAASGTPPRRTPGR